MNVVFRVDAALHIGSGHVMRCLTLADELTLQGAKCLFICREFTGNLCSFIQDKGYDVLTLSVDDINLVKIDNQRVPHEHWLGVDYSTDALQTISILNNLNIAIDWLIVDHYAIDIRWESLLRPYVKKIMLIDDLADRQHDGDLLLDQTYGRKESDYRQLLTNSCQYLLGAKYALLRREFLAYRKSALNYYDHDLLQDSVNRIFISMGGVDHDNCTGFIIDRINELAISKNDELHIVMGKNAIWLNEIKQQLSKLKCRHFLHYNVKNIAQIMSNCNLAIGAGGTTTWERCCLGIPSIVITTADNQKMIATRLAELGTHWYVGTFSRLSTSVFKAALSHALFDKRCLQVMSRIARDICDGYGVRRVANVLTNHSIRFLLATEEDIKLLYEWRNHPTIRFSSFNTAEIDYEVHCRWMKSKLVDKNCKILLALNDKQQKIGCVRLDIVGNIATISIYLDPNQLSYGYGKIVLQNIPLWLQQNNIYVEAIRAQVKSDNYASISIFKQSGYKEQSSDYLLTLQD